VRIAPLSDADRAAIEAWKYPAPYETYDHTGALEGDYRGVFADEELVGFVCFGEPARVPGVHEEPGLVDVGWGLRPDLMGKGLGPRMIEAALAQHAGSQHRIAVVHWNERARRAPTKCGFVQTGRVGDFVLMERPAE
jgi:[ribosomal protein S18]-alanine N-acetyltransferase